MSSFFSITTLGGEIGIYYSCRRGCICGVAAIFMFINCLKLKDHACDFENLNNYNECHNHYYYKYSKCNGNNTMDAVTILGSENGNS